jgi:hypothetical protein
MDYYHYFLIYLALATVAFNVAYPLWGFWRNSGILLTRDEDFE